MQADQFLLPPSRRRPGGHQHADHGVPNRPGHHIPGSCSLPGRPPAQRCQERDRWLRSAPSLPACPGVAPAPPAPSANQRDDNEQVMSPCYCRTQVGGRCKKRAWLPALLSLPGPGCGLSVQPATSPTAHSESPSPDRQPGTRLGGEFCMLVGTKGSHLHVQLVQRACAGAAWAWRAGTTKVVHLALTGWLQLFHNSPPVPGTNSTPWLDPGPTPLTAHISVTHTHTHTNNPPPPPTPTPRPYPPSQDPHFLGFDKSRFDYHGAPGTWKELLGVPKQQLHLRTQVDSQAMWGGGGRGEG